MDMDVIAPRYLRFNPPTFDAKDIAKIVVRDYGLYGEWTPLEGERDQNFRLNTQDGRTFVVKVAGPDEAPEVVDFQLQALLYLEKNAPQVPVPRIFRTRSGQCLCEIFSNKGVRHDLRIVTYLDGIPYGEGIFPDAQTLQKIGAFQGEVVNALAGFEHKASKHFMPWNLSNGIAVSKSLWAGTTDKVRKLGNPLLDRMRNEVLPQLNSTLSQVIHNDAHPYNLLRPDVSSPEVVGLIDFGDMVYAPVINELAVMAATFHRPDREDLDTVVNLLIGFHRVHLLSDGEVSLLWDAITLRVLITILLSDVKLNVSAEPDPGVIEERENGHGKLKIICSLDHETVVDILRAACGYR